MPTVSVRVSESIYNNAKMVSMIQTRSVGEQIEHWSKIGKIAESNPDLPYNVIKDVLVGIAQAEAGELEDYKFMGEN